METKFTATINNGDNWSDYKLKTLAYALKKKAFRIIEGTELAPNHASLSTTAGFDEAIYKKIKEDFEDRSNDMYCYIINTQSQSNTHLVRDAIFGDARDAWNKLLNFYESQSKASIKQLTYQLVEMKQGSKSVAEFVSDLFTTRNRLDEALKAKNVPLIDIITMMVMIQGLNPKYDSLKQNLFLDDTLTVNSCKEKLIENTERINMESTEPVAVALKVNQGVNHKNKNTKKQTYAPCPTCGLTNHPEDKCFVKYPHLKKTSTKNNNSVKITKSATAWTVRKPSTKTESTNQSYTDTIVFECDSGASEHFVKNPHCLDNFNPKEIIEVELADKTIVKTVGKGNVGLKLTGVHAAPSFSTNLLSMLKLYKDGIATLFHPYHGVVIANAKDMHVNCKAALCIGNMEDDAFKISVKSNKPNTTVSYATTTSITKQVHNTEPKVSTIEKALLQFQRLGLCHPTRIMEVHKRKAEYRIDLPHDLTLSQFNSVFEHEPYNLARSHVQPHPNKFGKKRSTTPFERIWLDIKVVNDRSYNHAEYFIVVVCDYTRWKDTIPLQKKSQLTSSLRTWYHQTVVPLGYKTKIIRCDNAGEQTGNEFKEFLTSISAKVEYTNAYSSASNGVAEKAIQTIMRTANALRINARFPKKAWAECVRTATFIENRLPTTANPLNKSPFEMLYNRPPDLSIMRVIGSKAYVHVHTPTTLSVNPKAQVGRLLGYAPNTNGYRILMNEKTGAIVDTIHVTFSEKVPESPNLILSLPGSLPEISIITTDTKNKVTESVTTSGVGGIIAIPPSVAHTPIVAPDPIAVTPPPAILAHQQVDQDNNHLILDDEILAHIDPRLIPQSYDKPQRTIKPVDRLTYDDSHFHPRSSGTTKFARARLVKSAVKKSKSPPLKYEDAIKDPLIRKAMFDELTNLFKSKAVKIVDLPTDKKPISNVWVHKLKYENGIFERARSRVCPRGYEQTPHVDYDPDDVASPTLGLDTGMLALGIEVERSQYSALVDVDSAYMMYAKPNHKIYMKMPDGMIKVPNKVLLIENSLQGTKQGAHDWHREANQSLETKLKFKRSTIDPCYYYRWDGECFTQIGLYVDDFRIASDSKEILDQVINDIGQIYKIKVKPATWWLGMNIEHLRESGVLKISMKQSILDLLNDFGMLDCKPERTPAAPNTKLVKPSQQSTDYEITNFKYRELVGALLWIARTGRPDILYAVGQLTQFNHLWDNTHIIAAKRVLRYLKGTMELSLTLNKSINDDNLLLKCFADSDFAAEPEENELPMRSISGMVAYLHGIGPIYSSASLEKTISLSTAEAEYKATSKAAQYCIGIRSLLNEIGFPQDTPTVIYNDNQACVTMVKQKFSSSRTRHIKLKFHHIREAVDNNEINVEYMPTDQMIADIMTKPLDRIKFERIRDVLMTGHRFSM
jgi:hypothetical protein